ncbi:MAG: LysR family transcriptional regulator [Oscillospiraceae bacterium]|nr:LysR family transcriptional regulator [Oscillospiraceae bacterium]
MELTLLYYFKTVAEMENITKAAESLYISQPALSKAIAKLEKSLGVTLFERRKGRISLSAMGQVYYEYVSSAFHVLETGEKKLEELKQQSGDTVSVASPVAGLLHEPIYNFLSSGEQVQIHQYFYEEHILESELLSGKLDFAVTPITIENSEIEQIKLMEEEVFIVVSQDHPLATQKYIRLADLKDDGFLVDEASFDQKIIRVLCGIAGFEPQILLHSNEGDLIDDALRNNLGVCLVPANLIYRKNMRNLAILRSTDVELVRLLSVAKRRDRIFQANAARLYHYTIHYFQNLGQELDEYFGNLLPEKQFSGRKSFGINNLKD